MTRAKVSSDNCHVITNWLVTSDKYQCQGTNDEWQVSSSEWQMTRGKLQVKTENMFLCVNEVILFIS